MRISTLVITSLIFLSSTFTHATFHHSPPSDKEFDHEGKLALIIATSHPYLDTFDKKTGKFIPPSKWTRDTLNSAGLYLPEATEPLKQFKKAKIKVEVASIQGGKIPITFMSTLFGIRTPADDEFYRDPEAQAMFNNSLKISEVDPSKYDLIFLAGGWGAAYDFPESEDLANFITKANALGKIIGAVCHGPLGLVKAKEVNGEPLLKGKKVTAVTDAQVRLLGLEGITPTKPQQVITKIGAEYQCESHWSYIDLFSNCVVQCGNLITGQNQRAGTEVADRMMQMLLEKDPNYHKNVKVKEIKSKL